MRGGQNRWGAAPGGWIGSRPTPGVIGALVVIGLGFIGSMAMPQFFVEHMALTPVKALGREPWQLLTAALVALHPGSLLSTGMTLWFFATPLEQMRGRRRMILVLGAATLIGSLVSAALGRLFLPAAVVTGAAPASMACLASFGVLYGAAPINLFGMAQMRASTCALMFLGISALMYLLDRDLLGGAGAAAGAGLGAILVRGAGTGSVRGTLDRFRMWRQRRRYRVVSGGRDSKRYLN